MEFAKVMSFLKKNDALPVKKFSHIADYTKSSCEITGHSGVKLHRITMVNEKGKDITCIVNTLVLDTFRKLNYCGFLWFDDVEDLEFFFMKTNLGNLNKMNYFGPSNSWDGRTPLYNEKGIIICELYPAHFYAYNRAVKRLVEDELTRASDRLREIFPSPYNLTINQLGDRRVLKCEFKDPEPFSWYGDRTSPYRFTLSFEEDVPEFIPDMPLPYKFMAKEKEVAILCNSMVFKDN